MIVIGGIWALFVIVTLTLPDENHGAAVTTVITLGVGVVWWLASLRGRLNRGLAGPSR
jgi:hypothetical protein